MTTSANIKEAVSFNSGITEIVLSNSTRLNNHDSLVLSMLAHLSRQCENAWFTWVSPRHISKDLLNVFDFARDKVRLIHTKSVNTSLRAFCTSLENGNSGSVVVDVKNLMEKDRHRFEKAAARGNTRGIVLRYR